MNALRRAAPPAAALALALWGLATARVHSAPGSDRAFQGRELAEASAALYVAGRYA